MIRVMIVHEIRLMCNMISASLQGERDIEIVGCATSLEEAKQHAQDCDIILLSCGLPSQGALAVTHAFRSGRAKIIVMGLPESESAILRFVEAGAAGYVSREDSTGELLNTIRAVHRGHALISPQVAGALIARTAELAERATQNSLAPLARTVRPNLSERELEVLTLIAEGYNNQEIARRLTIELGTVKNHVHNILKKLDVGTREQAAACLPWIERKAVAANAVSHLGAVPDARFLTPARTESMVDGSRGVWAYAYK